MVPASPIRLQLVVPFRQPLGASDAACEHASRACYRPLLAAVAACEDMRVAVHFGGRLLDWLARHDEALLLQVKDLVRRGQLEVLGGLFYGGIPALLPEPDVRGQIEMSGEFWDSVIGAHPRGFWLDKLAWAPEVPRMFEETGLLYGFVSATQLMRSEHAACSLGSVERGGQHVAAFVLDGALSAALAARPPDAWVAAAVARGGASADRLLSVWAPAEAFAPRPTDADPAAAAGRLQALFASITAAPQLELVLPADNFQPRRPARALRLQRPCAAELHALGLPGQAIGWRDFVVQYSEVDTLFRRMLRASGRLRHAIGIMEDEDLEDAWSDPLATAQRLVFAAQSPDAYWRGRGPGFAAPALRDATMARILAAEAILDGLLQGKGDWLRTEDADFDGDLMDDVMVITRHLGAWLTPANGGELRAFDDRHAARTLLDAGTRRHEPFFAELAAVSPPDAAGWPTAADSAPRRGTRQWVVAPDTQPATLLAGSASQLVAPRPTWDVEENGLGGAGSGPYTLAVVAHCALLRAAPQTLTVRRRVEVPVDDPRLRMHVALALAPGPPLLFALELPLRVGTAAARLRVDGQEVPACEGRVRAVQELEVCGADGGGIRVTLDAPGDVLCLPLRTTQRDASGFAVVEQGLVLMPLVEVTESAQLGVTLQPVAP